MEYTVFILLVFYSCKGSRNCYMKQYLLICGECGFLADTVVVPNEQTRENSGLGRRNDR